VSRRLAAFAAALAVAGPACVGSGVKKAELPEAPIAVLYRDAEQARRRAELFSEGESSIAPKQGVASLDSMGQYLGRLLGRPQGVDEQELAGRLFLIDPPTLSLREVESALPGATPVAWSADHRRLLFSQSIDGTPQLFEYDLDSNEVRPITRGPKAHPEGCYGPDGRIVATRAQVRQRQVYSRIVLTGPGGTDPRPISEGPQDHSPTCAPDGSAVVWVASGGRVPRLVSRMPLVDGEVKVLVPGRDPDFADAGGWVVYSAPSRGSWKLYRIRADGSGRSPVGREILEEQQPAISPDGQVVVYVTEKDHRASLYLRRFDGTGDRIYLRDGDLRFPTW